MIARTIGLTLNYRDASRTITCVQSLLDNEVSSVLVWDNSADGGKSADGIREAFFGQDRVMVHLSNDNLGFAAGVNRGLQLCRDIQQGGRVLLINNDARLLDGAVGKLQLALDATPTARIAFSDINHAGQVRGSAYYHKLTGLQTWTPAWGSFRYATGCCLLLATDRIPGTLFDEDFFMYGEDVELGWRLAQQPNATAYVPETLVEHEGSASSGMASLFYESHVSAGHLLLASKLARGTGEAFLFGLARLPILAARALVRSLRYRAMTPWRGLAIGLRTALRVARSKRRADF